MARARAPKRAKGAGRKAGRKAAPRQRAPAVNSRAVEATLADIAHEIRTPLTGILALGELLATSELGERERGWATSIKTTAEHLALLTSLIVDAARAQSKGLVLRRELIRPQRLAEAVAVTLNARAEAKSIASESVIAADLPAAVIGDALRLRAALENLTDNAIKFTERGSVRFEATSERAPRGRVRLIFTVTDSGIGMTAAEIRRLFRPFAQASEKIARRYGGAGLGLAFVKRIANAMGGDLTVTSAPGGGSRFQLSVIVDEVKPSDAATTAGAGAARAAALRPLHVLCVDDNPYGRVVINTILTELGHRADFVGTGEAAVDAVTHTRYDAVLMDVTLPGIDGIEATRRIRALSGDAGRVAIVGISGRATATDETAGRAAGMNGYLTKPLSPSALNAALEGLTVRSDM
jgi:CheY-like chemotaxis protein/nitrogen-specific signal transduction histidine kinase